MKLSLTLMLSACMCLTSSHGHGALQVIIKILKWLASYEIVHLCKPQNVLVGKASKRTFVWSLDSFQSLSLSIYIYICVCVCVHPSGYHTRSLLITSFVYSIRRRGSLNKAHIPSLGRCPVALRALEICASSDRTLPMLEHPYPWSSTHLSNFSALYTICTLAHSCAWFNNNTFREGNETVPPSLYTYHDGNNTIRVGT